MEKPVVLVTSRSFGSITERPMKILQEAGWHVLLDKDSFSMDRFREEIKDCDALIIGAHAFPAEEMRRCPRLKLIQKHGTGLDNIDLQAAKELGITVANAAGVNAGAVADLTFGLIIDCARRITEAALDVKNGIWKGKTGQNVFGKTIGIIGFGAIGREVARRARGFDMKVLTYDPVLTEVPEEYKEYVTLCPALCDMLPRCHFISLHVPLLESTRNLIGEEELALLPEGACVINAARGGIVNEDALVKALQSGHIAAAAADTTTVEPMPADHPFRSLPQMIVTSHIGMYTKETIDAISCICAENVAALAKGDPLKHVV